VVLLQLGQHGYTLPQRDPDLGTSMSLNFAFCLTVVVLFARSYSAERQRALEQIRAADRARAAFLANVSHEIRTPMNGVLGMTQVLLDGSLSAEQREQLLVIQRSGDALVALINDVLDSSKVEAGQLTVSREGDFDLRALLEDLAHLYEPMAKDKGLALAVDVGGGVVRGDGLRVRQVLGNLLSNAVKFTQSGSVRLLVERDGAQVRFTVEDTGAGIPPALRSRLFKPFQQGDDTSTKRYPGTGLGLSLSLQLATLLGGSLVLDEAYAAGARFVFSVALPVVEPRAPAVAVASPTRPAEGLAVLVVDDNPVNLAVARALVSKAGYVVQTATNGRDALAAVQGRAFAAVLMDVMMPEMDGLEATRQIRALPGPEREVPIIALTASAMPEELAACRAAGMNEVLTKPVVAAALTHALGAYARRG
jgi:signal transduction histidine kinase/CheY-like chemotaxis protein